MIPETIQIALIGLLGPVITTVGAIIIERMRKEKENRPTPTGSSQRRSRWPLVLGIASITMSVGVFFSAYYSTWRREATWYHRWTTGATPALLAKLSVGTFAQLEGYTKENDYYQPFSLYVTRARSDQPPKLSRVQMTPLSDFDAASRIDFVPIKEDGIGIYKTAKPGESDTGPEVQVFLKTPVVFNGSLTPGPRLNQ